MAPTVLSNVMRAAPRGARFLATASLILSVAACQNRGSGDATADNAAPPPKAAVRHALRAVGTEPGWMADIDSGRTPAMRLTLDYGERTLTVPSATPLAGEPGLTGKTGEGQAVTLRYQQAACSDGMSDREYPITVTLAVGATTYQGCGEIPEP